MIRTLLVLILAALPAAAQEKPKVKVVASLPDVGSIARSVGGDRVQVTTLALGYQDPHYVTPTPALMNAVSRADLYLEVGLSLEIWSERVLDGARNPKVRVGRPGHQFVSNGIRVLAVPKVVTRAQGDLHPQGNPHIWLDPLNGLTMARNTEEALTRVAPQYGDEFEANYVRFRDSLYEALYGAELVKLLGGTVLEKLDRSGRLIPFLEKKKLEGKPLITRLGGMHRTALAFRGKKAIFYHQSWVYFADRFGLDIRGYVEDKPGIAPSARHRDDLIDLVKAQKIPVVAVTNYYPKRVPKAISEATGAKMVVLPNATGGEEGAEEYIPFLELLVGRLAEAYR